MSELLDIGDEQQTFDNCVRMAIKLSRKYIPNTNNKITEPTSEEYEFATKLFIEVWLK